MKQFLIIVFLLSFIQVKSQYNITLVHKTQESANIGVLNNKLFFQSTETSVGEELMLSDGTAAGTSLFKDIIPGSNGSFPRMFKSALGKLLFRAGANAFADSLYITDGTVAGTTALCKIPTLYSSHTDGIELNGKYYFVNSTSSTGEELWVTDGTVAGTTLLKDIRVGTSSSNIGNFVALNNKIYFTADDGVTGKEIYESDGTTTGTILLKDIYTGGSPGVSSNLIVFNNKIYFSGNDGTTNDELWSSDGTSSGTALFTSILAGIGSKPSEFYVHNSKLYFNAEGPSIARELYVTDGTVSSTQLVSDIDPGTLSSNPYGFYAIGSTIFFAARTTNTEGIELRALNTTTNAINIMMDSWAGTNNGYTAVTGAYGEYTIAPLNNKAVVTAKINNNLNEIWVSDGTSSGTQKVLFSGATYTQARVNYLTPMDNNVYFYADYDGTYGVYKLSDGPSAASYVESKKIKIYPNPTNNFLNILNSENTTINITDVMGKSIFSKKDIKQQNILIDTKSWVKGIYFINMIKNGVIVRAEKLFKE